jgi:hypothetical protein
MSTSAGGNALSSSSPADAQRTLGGLGVADDFVKNEEDGALGVSMKRDFEHLARNRLDAEFFGKLALQGVARIFTSMDLAPRKFPRPGEVRPRLALGEKDPIFLQKHTGSHEKRRGSGGGRVIGHGRFGGARETDEL